MAVGAGVAVGGTDVAVGGTGVAVGGTGVAVGGTGVAVGGTSVAVGGTAVAVAVGGTGVDVGAVVAVGSGDVHANTNIAAAITPTSAHAPYTFFLIQFPPISVPRRAARFSQVKI